MLAHVLVLLIVKMLSGVVLHRYIEISMYVRGEITAVGFPACGIAYHTLYVWISLDHHGILAVLVISVSCRLDSCILFGLYLFFCWPHKHRV